MPLLIMHQHHSSFFPKLILPNFQSSSLIVMDWLLHRFHCSSWQPGRSNPACTKWVVPFTIWICVCLSVRYGYYGSTRITLGPGSSRLLLASSFFVDELQVKDVGTKGVKLYGFLEKPELTNEANCTITKSLSIAQYHRQGFSVWLNQGSRIQARWYTKTPHLTDPLLVLLRGTKSYRKSLGDPHNTNVIDVQRLKEGRGAINFTVEEDDTYYIGAVNLNLKSVNTTMIVNITSKVYDTNNADSKCSTKSGVCKFKLKFPNTHYAVLATATDPDFNYDDDDGDEDNDSTWYVELSYAGRIATYVLVLGFFVAIIYLFLKYFGAIESDRPATPRPARPSRNESSPLVTKETTSSAYGALDEDVENGSFSSSSSEELYDGKICVICYEEPRNCFFVPCGHCATCYTCAQKIEGVDCKPCPICRRPIHKIRRLITS